MLLLARYARSAAINETIAVAKEQKRKAYLKEYMATRRRNNEFRIKKNRALEAKSTVNIEKKKTRDAQRQALNRCKEF